MVRDDQDQGAADRGAPSGHCGESLALEQGDTRFPATVNVGLNANLNAQADLLFLDPTYTFASPVLGGQLAIGVTGIFGRSAASLNGALTANIGGLHPCGSSRPEPPPATTAADFDCCPLSALPAAEARWLKNPFVMSLLKAWRESSSHQ